MNDPGERVLIHEVIALHGHVVDEGEFDRLTEVFLPDVEYDVSALGGGVLHGVEQLSSAGRQLGEGNPLGHHVTNIVVQRLEGDRASVASKGLAIMSDGTAASVTYQDTVVRTDTGWRISRRVVLPRRTPLAPSGGG